MFRSIAGCFLLLLGFTVARAQKTQDITLKLPTVKVSNSHYNTIRCLDIRPDTTNLGVVQLGAFNRKAKVVPKKPFTQQLSAVFNSAIDGIAKNHELILQIRQFSFAEITAGFSEKGYCYLRAALYAKGADLYQKVSSIDTVICLKSSLDVTQMILDTGGVVISSFIQKNLLKDPAGITYTYNNILNIDSFEKQQLKVYTTSTYVDGVYLTYQSFRDQLPDQQFTINGDDVNTATIKTTGADGKPQKVKAKNVYALVYKGHAYISSLTEYCPLKKVNDDLVFTGPGKLAPNTADVITASMFFGVIGSLAATNVESTFEMKIDHINGGFIRIREIIPPPYEPQ